jgi:hypothetical protein
MTVFQPRYVAYAAAHGRTPVDQLAADRDRFPGGHMAGFTTWLADRWAEFGIPMMSRSTSDAEQDAFTAWLTELARPGHGERVVLADGRRGVCTFVLTGQSTPDAIRFVADGNPSQCWEWVPLADVRPDRTADGER